MLPFLQPMTFVILLCLSLEVSAALPFFEFVRVLADFGGKSNKVQKMQIVPRKVASLD